MPIHFFHSRLIGLALIGGIALALWLQVKQAKQERSLPQMTAEQALTRSEPICRAVLPEAKTLRLSTEYHRGDRNFLSVNFRSETSDRSGHIDWAPETGELAQFGCLSHTPLRPGQASLSRQEALIRMRRWLACLRPELADTWHASGSLKMNRGWNPMQVWEGHGMHAMTTIDSRSGDLLLCWFWHPRQ